MSEICIIVTIVVYLAAMLLVGFAYSKTNNDSADFYLGGRKMGPLVTAMSAEASDMSSWLLMGMPGLAYLTGIASPGWTAIGLALGTWLNWLIVARRLRRYSASHDAVTGGATSYSLLDIVSTMAWGLGYFGMPHILLRFMAIEDEKKLVLSRRIATVWVVIAMTASIVIGMVGLGMTRVGALEFLSGSSSETLILRIASLISQHGVLAAVLAGLILAGILAATMSTADSQMLAAASSVSQNILQEFGHLKLSEKQSLFAARLTIICVSVVGVVLARDPDSSVFGIVSFAWAGFGGSFGAVVLCSLFWKRCNWQGALAGMLCGGLMVFVWKYLISPLGGVFGIYELLPAFLFSLAACVVVSLATPAPGADIEAEFEAAK